MAEATKTIKMEEAQKLMGYRFKNTDLLREALLATPSWSWPYKGRYIHWEGNKALAGIGDTVLALAFRLRGYETKDVVGQTAHVIQKNANNTRLAEVCENAGFVKCMIGDAAQAKSGFAKATLLKALIGAVYIDSDMDVAAASEFAESVGVHVGNLEAE